jgi:hypothetical protein
VSVYIITGKLGSGKNLHAIRKMREAGDRGCRIASNIDLNIEHMWSSRRVVDVVRLADFPTAEQLYELGRGYEGRKFDEKLFGWLVLDEAAIFLNSREYQGDSGETDREVRRAQAKARMQLLGWLRHARKFRWHLILITQDLESLDAQARRALAEHVVECRRLDSYSVPGLSLLAKTLGFQRVKMPQVHFALVRVLRGASSPIADRWVISEARQLYKCYNTEQEIMGENLGYSVLSSRQASYLWRPRGMWEALWELVLWRLFPESEARRRFNDCRFFQEHGSYYKPAAPSFAEWSAAQAAHAGPLGGEAGEAAEPELVELVA